MTYDSKSETMKHISKVQERLEEVLENVRGRWRVHDRSKLESPEKEAFDSLGPPEEMARLVYGSEEYKAQLRTIKPAIEHHYRKNDHHPEHFVVWRCPLCKSIWTESDLAEDKRQPYFCPACEPQGWMYEAKLEPDSGIGGMSLMGLMEMLADWKAAGERHTTGSMKESLEKNRGRFKIEPQLQKVLENTARELGWL